MMTCESKNNYKIENRKCYSLFKNRDKNREHNYASEIGDKLLKQLQQSERTIKQVLLNLKQDIKGSLPKKVNQKQQKISNESSFFGGALMIQKIKGRLKTVGNRQDKKAQKIQKQGQFVFYNTMRNTNMNQMENKPRKKAKTQQNQYQEFAITQEIFSPVGNAKKEEKRQRQFIYHSKTQNQLKFQLFQLQKTSFEKQIKDKNTNQSYWHLRRRIRQPLTIRPNSIRLLSHSIVLKNKWSSIRKNNVKKQVQ